MSRILFLLAALSIATAARAHEFWVEPADASLAPGETLIADIVLGSDFKGNRFRYNPAKFRRFDIVGPDGTVPVVSRLGDKPALEQVAETAGLHVVAYVGEVERTSYFKLADFLKFTDDMGFADAAERHRTRGLPEDAIHEAYTRFAKALVRVGETQEADRTLGLEIELILLAKPAAGTVRVQALLQGKPMVGVKLRGFSRVVGADSGMEAESLAVLTDEEGIASVPLAPGRRYLLNVVHLRVPSEELAKARNVDWETLWASTVFETE